MLKRLHLTLWFLLCSYAAAQTDLVYQMDHDFVGNFLANGNTNASSFHMTGQLHTTDTNTSEDPAYIANLEVTSQHLTASQASALSQQLQEELDGEFRILRNSNGEITGIRHAPGLSAEAVNLLKGIASYFQISTGSGTQYRARERDVSGSYLADYQITFKNEGGAWYTVFTRTAKTYESLSGGAAVPASFQSQGAKETWFNLAGVPERIIINESISGGVTQASTNASSGSGYNTDTGFVHQFVGEIVLISSTRSAWRASTNTNLVTADIVGQPSADTETPLSLSELNQLQTQIESMLIKGDHETAPTLDNLHDALVTLFQNDPYRSDDLVDALFQNRIVEDRRNALINALGEIDHDVTRRNLVLILDEYGDTSGGISDADIQSALLTVALMDAPDTQLYQALQRIIDAPTGNEGARFNARRVQALYTMGAALYHGWPEGNVYYQNLLNGLATAPNAADLGFHLTALGNLREHAPFQVLQTYLNHGDGTVRARAVSGLSALYQQSYNIDNLLKSKLSGDQDSTVRRAAIDAISQRPKPSEAYVQQIADLARYESDAVVAGAIMSYAAQHSSDVEHYNDLLRTLSSSAANPVIRDDASRMLGFEPSSPTGGEEGGSRKAGEPDTISKEWSKTYGSGLMQGSIYGRVEGTRTDTSQSMVIEGGARAQLADQHVDAVKVGLNYSKAANGSAKVNLYLKVLDLTVWEDDSVQAAPQDFNKKLVRGKDIVVATYYGIEVYIRFDVDAVLGLAKIHDMAVDLNKKDILLGIGPYANISASGQVGFKFFCFKLYVKLSATLLDTKLKMVGRFNWSEAPSISEYRVILEQQKWKITLTLEFKWCLSTSKWPLWTDGGPVESKELSRKFSPPNNLRMVGIEYRDHPLGPFAHHANKFRASVINNSNSRTLYPARVDVMVNGQKVKTITVPTDAFGYNSLGPYETFAFDFTAYTPEDHLDIELVANSSREVYETNYDDNSLTYHHAAIPPDSDLVIGPISLSPPNPRAGQTVQIQSRVENIGVGPTPNHTLQKVKVGFYLDGVYKAEYAVPLHNLGSNGPNIYSYSLYPGQSTRVHANIVWPGGGNHVVKLVADYQDDIEELFENNNENSVNSISSFNLGVPVLQNVVGEPWASHPVLNWYGVNGANRYEIYVHHFNSGLTDTYFATGTSVQINAVPGTSTWKVRAHNTQTGEVGDWSTQGNVRYIDVNIDQTLAPQPISPDGQAQNRLVRFNWEGILPFSSPSGNPIYEYHDLYEVLIETANGSEVIFQGEINDLEMSLYIWDAGDYRWSVRAVYPYIQPALLGAWSDWMSFSQSQDSPGDALHVPTPLSPAGLVDTPHAILEWTDHPSVERYEVEVRLDGASTSQYYLANTNRYALNYVTPGQIYHWRVRSQQRIGGQWVSGWWSPSMTFYVSDGTELADLVISDIALVGTPTVGQGASARITLRNTGAAATRVDDLVQVKIMWGAVGNASALLSAAPGGGGGGIAVVGTRTYLHVNASNQPLVIPAGGTVTITHNFDVSWEDFFISAEVNPNNSVPEANSSNNLRYETFEAAP